MWLAKGFSRVFMSGARLIDASILLAEPFSHCVSTQCIVPIFLFFSLLFSVKLYRSNPGTLQGLLDFNLIKSKDLILFHACALFLPRGRFGLIMTYSFSWSV